MTLKKAFESTIMKLYPFYELRYNSCFVFNLIEKNYPNLDFARSYLDWLYTEYINDLDFKFL